jgi:hypothetical protein
VLGVLHLPLVPLVSGYAAVTGGHLTPGALVAFAAEVGYIVILCLLATVWLERRDLGNL